MKLKKNTELLKRAGWVFLAGVIILSIGSFMDSSGRGVSAGAWFMFGFVLISLSPILLLMGAVNYLRAPKKLPPSTAQEPAPAVKAENQRKPIANWRRVIAGLVAIPVALTGLGWLTINGWLPEFKEGPVDSEFLRVAGLKLLSVLIIGSIVYRAVLAIDVQEIGGWLKEKR